MTDPTVPPAVPVIDVNPETVAVAAVSADAMTVSISDDIVVRVLSDGTIRLRALHHTAHVVWLTNKPEDGDNSVVGIQLTRKDMS